MAKFELKRMIGNKEGLETLATFDHVPVRVLRNMYKLDDQIAKLQEKYEKDLENGSVTNIELSRLEVLDLKIKFISDVIFRDNPNVTFDVIDEQVPTTEINQFLNDMPYIIYGIDKEQILDEDGDIESEGK